MSELMEQLPCVIIVGGSWGFPNGMAASKRVALFGRALILSGYNVEVIHTTVSERNGKVINKEAEGYFKNIHFRYATGNTVASKYFLIRRLVQLNGKLRTILSIWEIFQKYNLKGIIIYSRQFSSVALISLVGKILRTRLILELNEWPMARKGLSPIQKLLATIFCHVSPFLVDDFIVISRFIEQKINLINPKIIGKVLRVPILVDTSTEFDHSSRYELNDLDRYLVFSGSLDYQETIKFIMDAYLKVLQQNQMCKLVITGKTSQIGNEKRIRDMIASKNLTKSVELTGYVSDEILRNIQKKAQCLLAPLENDDQSEARMPTKIAEYLLIGRPVITSSVGDIAEYLIDRKNAYVCPPEDVDSFAHAIIHVLSNPDEALNIAAEGSKVAKNIFDFENYSNELGQLFKK